MLVWGLCGLERFWWDQGEKISIATDVTHTQRTLRSRWPWKCISNQRHFQPGYKLWRHNKNSLLVMLSLQGLAFIEFIELLHSSIIVQLISIEPCDSLIFLKPSWLNAIPEKRLEQAYLLMLKLDLKYLHTIRYLHIKTHLIWGNQ